MTVLHADCNSFYVSCEMSANPSLRGKAVVVGGDVEARHGIVLAKSELAKKAGIQTGHVIWQAKKLCPNLIVLPPNYALYLRVAQEVRHIFSDYTGKVEPFGLDEAWLGMDGDTLACGKMTADKIRARLSKDLGITASIGVADNKVMAKLGSDLKKPDATTVLAPEEYETHVWPLPISDLLYVGRATRVKLANIGLHTIGDVAKCDAAVLRRLLGINGEMLWRFANGLDTTPVAETGHEAQIKSIGNSTTTPRDLENWEDIKFTVFILAESVAQRLRESGFRARTIQLHVRDNALFTFERQVKLKRPTNLAHEIIACAMELFRQNYDLSKDRPVRSLGVRGTDLEAAGDTVQLSFLPEERKRSNLEILEGTLDGIRKKYGHFAVQRASLIGDPIGRIDPKNEHAFAHTTYYNINSKP